MVSENSKTRLQSLYNDAVETRKLVAAYNYKRQIDLIEQTSTISPNESQIDPNQISMF